MTKRYILECCVDSAESAAAACKGGADRLELCGNLVIGGTTPGIHLFQAVREKVPLKLHVLIRPRFGDFCHTDDEFRIMVKDVGMFKKSGADGVVIGVLKEDGSLDRDRMKELVSAAEGMSVTLHRAFDMCRDPFRTLEDAKDLGIHTILTSGQKDNCLDGKELIRQLVEQAGKEMEILVGGGIRETVVGELAATTKARAFHMSGSVKADSPMVYRKEGISMGRPVLSEYTILRTDEKEIAKVKKLLDSLL